MQMSLSYTYHLALPEQRLHCWAQLHILDVERCTYVCVYKRFMGEGVTGSVHVYQHPGENVFTLQLVSPEMKTTLLFSSFMVLSTDIIPHFGTHQRGWRNHKQLLIRGSIISVISKFWDKISGIEILNAEYEEICYLPLWHKMYSSKCSGDNI